MSKWMALLLIVAYAAAASPSAGSFGGFHRILTASSRPKNTSSSIHQCRGGAIASDSDEYDEYDSEEEDEPIVTTAKKLAASTKTVAAKKKSAAVKAKVKVAMASSSSSATKTVAKKSGGGNLYKRYVPYIVRACLNPFTLLAMTKAYFVSLCDINYLKEDPSQNLRSALQEKARNQQPPAGSTKPKRKMKPGQAKTISDLPQLSA